MKFTNKHNLPEGIVNAVKNDLYEKGDSKYSATELLSPPQLNRLRKLHWHELEVDVSEEIWKLFGSAVHYILEQGSKEKVNLDEQPDATQLREEAATRNINPFVQTEERLYASMGGVKISGKPDWYNSYEGVVQDYKVTQVYKVQKGDLSDWEAQGNIYAWLFEDNQMDVNSFQIVAILKDWKPSEKARAKPEDNYPDTQVQIVDIPLMNPLSRARFVLERVELHESVSKLTNAEDIYKASSCSAEDRWHQPDSFAVMKKGGKRATPGGVFDNLKEAQAFLEEKGSEYEIEHRLGADKRCEEYCPVAKFCAQYKEIQAQKNKGSVQLPDEKPIKDSLPSEKPKPVEPKEEPKSLFEDDTTPVNPDKPLTLAEQMLAKARAKKKAKEAEQHTAAEEAHNEIKEIGEKLDNASAKAREKVEKENSLETLMGDMDDILEGL
jgi:hypothetical protein